MGVPYMAVRYSNRRDRVPDDIAVLPFLNSSLIPTLLQPRVALALAVAQGEGLNMASKIRNRKFEFRNIKSNFVIQIRMKRVLILIVFSLMLLGSVGVKAQCAMCSTTVESNQKSGAHTAKGLNSGILYLLAAPYLAVVVVGFVWYKKYRRKNIDLNVPHEKLNLN